MSEETKWTNLSPGEIAEYMAIQGITVSNSSVRELLKLHGFKKRKLKKCRTFKSVKSRDAQFKNIHRLKEEYRNTNNPVISIDGKKKETIGLLHRDGAIYSIEPLESYDHDFSSYGEGKVSQYAIYDIYKKKGKMYFSMGPETTEFACDCVKNWWFEIGQYDYPEATRILILADGGGSNSCRYYIFKFDLQGISTEMGMEIRMAHYPPYTSKYNPIEHQLFCHVTRACAGVMLTSVEILKKLIENTKTSKGLKVSATIVDKVYQKGRKVAEDFKKNLPIIADAFLRQWNYRVVPQ